MLYASKSLKGFFDDQASGTRLVDVPDPDWKRPTRTVVLAPGEVLDVPGHERVINTGNAPITLSEVPDWDADHPLITVANPDCRLPADAVEISRELRDACLAAPSIDWSGDMPAPGVSAPLSTQQSVALLVADAQALLVKSDVTVSRCSENEVPVPASWRNYRAALRAIVTTGAGVVPPRPEYPPGT